MKLTFAVLPLLASAGTNSITCGSPDSGPVLNGLDLVDTLKNVAFGNAPVFANSTDAVTYTDDDGFEFKFNSKENMQAYLDTPTLYQIGAGGYCGYAISGNDPACGSDGDACNGPACLTDDDAVEILENDGKMYFFLGNGALNKFMKADGAPEDAAANLEEARLKSGYANCYNTDTYRCKN